MTNTNGRERSEYVVCIDNSDYAASLQRHKIYRVIDDAAGRAAGDTRIIDESGEDYLYPSERFIPIILPAEVKEELAFD